VLAEAANIKRERHCEVRSNLYALQSEPAYRGLLRTSQ